MRNRLKKLTTDKNGKVVIFQPPNLPLVGWFICMIVATLLPISFMKNGFINLSGAFLFLWSYQEITQGASYFRRFLGVVILSVVVGAFFI